MSLAAGLRRGPGSAAAVLRQGPAAGTGMIRAVTLLRAGYGAALLCVPGTVIGACTGQPAGTAGRSVARVLGGRHLAQAALTAWMPTDLVLTAGAGTDLAHAASMLALASARRPLRPAELADGLTAICLAGLTITGLAITGLAGPGWPGRR